MAKTTITSSSAELLARKKIAVLGFGSQGSAQAGNLRDSGFTPLIGLLSGSKSRKAAKKERFEITTPFKAMESADIIAVLVPDHKQKALFDSVPASVLSGKTLVFAHGLSIHFGLVKPPPDCDTALVAPHGPGLRISPANRLPPLLEWAKTLPKGPPKRRELTRRPSDAHANTSLSRTLKTKLSAIYSASRRFCAAGWWA
jgi:hypothetical protein